MKILRTTQEHSKYWRDRKIDWKTSYFDTWNHPHRYMISDYLKQLNWMSLIEIGCGAGANLANIIQTIKGRPMQLGGIDVSPDAIEFCQKTFKGGLFKVSTGEDVMMSDKSTDLTLTDMALIYVGPLSIDKYIKEIKRITRKYVVLCEFHDTSWWRRIKSKFRSGYNTYNYKKLLSKHGFYDIMVKKIPQDVWTSKDPRCIIIAKVPER